MLCGSYHFSTQSLTPQTAVTSKIMPYADDPAWADVPKVPQDDGPNPVVSIAYSPRFTDVMDCFRGVLKTNELSARTLALTLDVIDVNPANYTVWHFRRRVLDALGSDLHAELRFTQELALEHPKNYQIWHHRREICSRLGNGDEEKRFTRAAIAGDAKNYHAWAHRQWAVKTFGLWDGELAFVDELLAADARNNSAWNHRWVVVEHMTALTVEVREKEVGYVLEHIKRAPHNESPWNYLRGLVRGFEGRLAVKVVPELRETMERVPDCVFAAALLIELYAKADGSDEAVADAVKLVDTLMDETDRVRKPYWQLRKKMLLAGK